VPPQGRLDSSGRLDTLRRETAGKYYSGTAPCARASHLLSRRFHRLWPSRNRTTFLAVLTCNTKMNAPENKKSQVEMRTADDDKL